MCLKADIFIIDILTIYWFPNPFIQLVFYNDRLSLVDASAVELAHGNGMQGKMGRTPSTASLRPEIPEALPNITVAVGREAILPCVVKNLKDYKVQ